jgi:hypothetical protein
MKWFNYPTPKLKDERIVRRYLIFPESNPTNSKDIRWLKWVVCKQVYDYYGWEYPEWIDTEWDVEQSSGTPNTHSAK